MGVAGRRWHGQPLSAALCFAALLFCSLAPLLCCSITLLLSCSLAFLLYCSTALLSSCCAAGRLAGWQAVMLCRGQWVDVRWVTR